MPIIREWGQSLIRRDMGASLIAQLVKNLPTNARDERDRVRSLGWEDPLKEEIATHSSSLA